jgi:hypothetical protein
MYLSSKHAEILLKENACFCHFTKIYLPRWRVIVVATCFLGRLNLVLARTLSIWTVSLLCECTDNRATAYLHQFISSVICKLTSSLSQTIWFASKIMRLTYGQNVTLWMQETTIRYVLLSLVSVPSFPVYLSLVMSPVEQISPLPNHLVCIINSSFVSTLWPHSSITIQSILGHH